MSEQVYDRRGYETLLPADGDAYLTFGRESAEPPVAEFGGSADRVMGLLASVFERYDI